MEVRLRFEDGAVWFEEEITPAAEWVFDNEAYSLVDIPRIDFGGSYEDALWSVAQARTKR